MRRVVATAVVLSLSSGVLEAHHSTAMFDRDKEVTIEGVVTRFEWSNPHCWLYIKTTDGKNIEWGFEAGSPNILGRQGWTRNGLKPGDKVSVLTHPLRDGTNGGIIMKVTVQGGDGKTYYYHG